MRANHRPKESQTITVKIGPGISKGRAAFNIVSRTPRHLLKRQAPAIRRAIGVSRSTFDNVMRLRRIIDERPESWTALEGQVLEGVLSPKQALEIVAKVEKKEPGKLPGRHRVASKVYQRVCALREPLPYGMLAELQRGLGVSQSVIMDALRLHRLLAKDRELHAEWQGQALTGIFSARTILGKIAAEKKTQPRK